MIPGAGAGDVEQVALGVVNFLQIGVVADRLDARLAIGSVLKFLFRHDS